MSNEKIKELTDECEILKKQIEAVLIDRHILREYFKIVKANPDICNTNIFHRFVMKGYSSNILISTRRLMDKTKNTFSLYKFLEKINNNSKEITRKWYIDTFKYDWTDTDFTRIAGSGSFFCKKISSQDLDELVKLSKKIEDTADSYIAHNSKNPKVFEWPQMNEVDLLIDKMEEIFLKYYTLFTGQGYSTFLPTIQYDWQEIFTIPWINK